MNLFKKSEGAFLLSIIFAAILVTVLLSPLFDTYSASLHYLRRVEE